ncbi:hypothetical protein [Streptomyces fungicidicus]|uniref:hypothetical protein n=1 Tax=Streptomyces fungicidicus TaxID=68203 RepID=UPI003655C92B
MQLQPPQSSPSRPTKWTEQRRYIGPDILAECLSGKSAEPGTPDPGGQQPTLGH